MQISEQIFCNKFSIPISYIRMRIGHFYCSICKKIG